MIYVELSFPITGAALPCDHGRAMFRAISRLVPESASAGWLLIKDLSHTEHSDGTCACPLSARLRMRMPQHRLPLMLGLARRQLQVGGHPVRLGTPEISLLYPCPSLYARCVVINGCSRPDQFLDALAWRLDERGIPGEIELGRRRQFRAGRRAITGFALTLHDLSEESSIALQEQGLGNHRHLGCGFFVPVMKILA